MKSILFNTAMVQAILEGRKTVTRRAIKPQPAGELRPMGRGSCWPGCFEASGEERIYRPPYQPGDVLYVRETWAEMPYGYVYRADEEQPEGWEVDDCWRPSIHMPRAAARIFLRVTAVKVARLRDMVLADVLMEGVEEADAYENTWDSWHQTWNSTIKPKVLPVYGWEANPWVWVIGFERISREEAEKRLRGVSV